MADDGMARGIQGKMPGDGPPPNSGNNGSLMDYLQKAIDESMADLIRTYDQLSQGVQSLVSPEPMISTPTPAFDFFGFVSFGVKYPGPARFGLEGISLLGLSNSGPYAGFIKSIGARYGGEANYLEGWTGTESILSGNGIQSAPFKSVGGSTGIEVPFAAGLGAGGGAYFAGGHSGAYVNVGGEVLGFSAAIGFGGMFE